MIYLYLGNRTDISKYYVIEMRVSRLVEIFRMLLPLQYIILDLYLHFAPLGTNKENIKRHIILILP